MIAVRYRVSFLLLLGSVAAGNPNFTLRIAEVGPLDPLTPSPDDSTSLLIQELVYEPLLVPDDTGELAPRLAHTWSLLPNGNLYVEPDTTRVFSDGSSVTVQEVIDSLSAVGLRSSLLGAGLEILPGANRVRPEVAVLRATVFKKVPGGYIGTGPFAIVSQDPDRIVLQRTFHVPHRIDRVELVGYPTPLDVLKALAKGDCNGAVGVGPTPVELFFNYMPQFRILPVPPFRRQAIIFNHKLISRTDRRILALVLRASGLEAIGPGTPETVSPEVASLRPGPKISVVTWNADWASQRLALAVRRSLGKRGGDVVALPPSDANAAFLQGRFGIAIAPFQTWPDAEVLSRWRSGGQYAATGYSNPDLDVALDAGDWEAARRAFDLDPPGVFLLEWTTFAVFDSRIFNPVLGRFQLFGSLHTWEVP